VHRFPEAAGRTKSISPEEEIFMVRRLFLLLGLVFLASLSAHAQSDPDKFQLYGGFSYLRLDSSPGTNLKGWNASAQYKVNNWLGGVMDLSGNYESPGSVTTFLFGPQVSWHARVSPFARLLVGGAHFSGSGLKDTSLSESIGAGFDTRINHRLSWRIIQGDYIHTEFFGTSQNNIRVSTGIVLRF
jgi:Outer membrane protein beta-barrel domain